MTVTEQHNRGVLPQYKPWLDNVRLRTFLAGVLLLACAWFAAVGNPDAAYLTVAGVLFFPWAIAVVLTDKYRHKYPQRYYAYLLACHFKAMMVMVFFVGVGWLLVDSAPFLVLVQGLFSFIVLDAVLSMPRQRCPARSLDDMLGSFAPKASKASDGAVDTDLVQLDGTQVGRRLAGMGLSSSVQDLLTSALPAAGQPVDPCHIVTLADDRALATISGEQHLMIADFLLNDVRRINRFLLACTGHLPMGAYLLIRYEPLETVARRLAGKHRALRLLHFAFYRALPKIPLLNKVYFALTRGKGRNISKAEVWGRLTFCGFEVVREQDLGDDRLVLARRVEPAVVGRRPSYYPVVGLQKVGLNGEFLYCHKVRSMYPFSEFLQKRIFEDHGLTEQGKFQNDFRLTEYGPKIRKMWIDEIPQLFDWLHGEIKLVGLRATSAHYLSLYPRNYLELYVQVKPGLIPPIFDEETTGFDDIVKVDQAYLESYLVDPLRTDIRYFMQTFGDIFVRGVRSN